MKKTAFVLALLALPAIAFAGNATLSLAQNTTNATSVTFGPTGGQLVVNMWLNTTAAECPEGVANIVGNLAAYKANGTTTVNNVFSAVARQANHAQGYGPFDSVDTWDVSPNGAGTAFAGAMNPYSLSFGVGATGGQGTQTPKKNYAVPTAAYEVYDAINDVYIPYSFTIPWKLMKITLNVAPVPGSYVLGFTPDSYVGTTINNGVITSAMTTALSGMSVIVTPEPATMLLLAAAVPFLRRRSA